MRQRPNPGLITLLIALAVAVLPATQAATIEFGSMDVIRLAPGQLQWGHMAINQPTHTPSGLIEKDADVNDGFEHQINQGLGKVSSSVLTALARNGYKIKLSETVTEAVPAARNQQVRGYKPHETWDSVYGMFNRTTKRVVMAELAQQKDSNGRITMVPLRDVQRREGILRHEIGHAVDQMLGNVSHSAEFKAAYDKGLKTISQAERQVLSYYLQPGEAGREETFAEIFACLDGFACDRNSDILLKNHFPELVQLIKYKVQNVRS